MSSPVLPQSWRKRRAKAAFARHLDEIRAVAREALLPVNISVEATVDRALRAVPLVAPLRHEMVTRLPDFDPATVDRLEGYALALHYSNLLCVQPVEGTPSTRALVLSSSRCRAHLLDDAKALVRHQLLPAAALSRFTGKPTRQQLAVDITELVQMLRQSWPTISDKTALTLRQLKAAEALARLLTQSLVDSGKATANRRDHQLIRAQAFTLLVLTYNDVRRAVAYLRWSEHEQLVPSLYADRRRLARPGARTNKGHDRVLSMSTSP